MKIKKLLILAMFGLVGQSLFAATIGVTNTSQQKWK